MRDDTAVVARVISPVSTLREFDCRDRPLAFVTSDRNSQTMKFIKPNLVYRPGLSIGQNHGFADKLCLSFVEFGEDVARSRFGDWHDVARIGCGRKVPGRT